MGHTPVRFKDRAPGWKRTLGDKTTNSKLYSYLLVCLGIERKNPGASCMLRKCSRDNPLMYPI